MQALLLLSVLVLANSHQYHHPHHHHHDHHSLSVDPPPQDQCHDVDAKEPPQCPQTIGPPCPPCYTNSMADYSTGNDLQFSQSSKQSINDFMTFYTNWWNSNYPPHKTQSGYAVYSGSAGRALLFLRLYRYSDKNETLLNIASDYIDHAISILPREQHYAAYMSSFSGVWTLKAMIENLKGNNYQTYIDQIQTTYENVNKAIIDGDDTSADGINMTLIDMEIGVTGMIYNALFLNSYFQKEVIDPEMIANITYYVLDFAIKTGNDLNTNFLQIPFYAQSDCYLYGPNHGPTGMIHDLYLLQLVYPKIMSEILANPKYYNAIKNTLDFYISIQLSDGNMPTNVEGTCENNYGNDSDARVQFCHGAPGFVNVFMESAVMFSDYNASAAQEYVDIALSTANVTWERGLLVKGTMFCHGIGANTNMLWNLGQNIDYLQKNGNAAFLKQLSDNGYDLNFLKNQAVWRTKQFVLWTLDWDNINQTRIYDSNEDYSMFAGNFGIPMLYIQVLQSGWPFDEHVCHPGWNLCV